jgi:hypothetical protein
LENVMIAQKKVRSWCEACEAWHPLGQHVRPQKAEAEAGAEAEADMELRAEPRPAVARPAREARGSNLLRLALFMCVILPAGVVAWAGAAYAVLLLWPHIKAALP